MGSRHHQKGTGRTLVACDMERHLSSLFTEGELPTLPVRITGCGDLQAPVGLGPGLEGDDVVPVPVPAQLAPVLTAVCSDVQYEPESAAGEQAGTPRSC